MIRTARPEDVPAIHRLVRDLAGHVRGPQATSASEADLKEALFSAGPAAFAHVAVHTDSAGHESVAGVALWFLSFSTWTGRHGIYLEDLFVRPELRGHGYGRALMAELARVCAENGYTRLEWSVLDRDSNAIGFYRSLGSRAVDDTTTHRLDGADLAALSER